jgi:2'-5' RNA ligase
LDQIRSFIAIELPEEVRTGLKQIEDRLKSFDSSAAKWVDPQSIHLTLKFLGNVEVDKISPIIQAMQDAAIRATPFELKTDGLGCFPNPKRVQVVWVGLIGELEKLQALQKNVELLVAPLGFPTEKRPFAPHLTLARVRESVTPIQRQNLGDKIIETQIELDLSIKVNSVSLMRSRLTPTGAIYTRLGLIGLK